MSRGFTIVELLIVIVVIAILAAISIVAYNGIQARAKISQHTTAISQYAKAVQMYVADKGSLPVTVATTSSFACINPATSNPACYGAVNADTTTATNTLTSNMQPYLSSTPSFLTGEPVMFTYSAGASTGTTTEDDTYFWVRFPGTLDACPAASGLRPLDGGTASHDNTAVAGKTVCRYLIVR